MTLPVGKVPMELLREVLSGLPKGGDRVLLGPAVGRDAAVVDFGERALVVATDPVTFATDEIGWYAVHINANDISTTGARPLWFFSTLLLPEGSANEELFRDIMGQIERACRGLGVTVCGGHSEVTLSLDRPIVVGTMMGEVCKDNLVRQDGAREGDMVILTKGVAIEGTAVLAREHPKVQRILPPELVERCRRFIREPGISVVPEALTAAAVADVSSMHDPTEGGLATALYELAEASGVGMKIRKEAIHVYEETRIICEQLHLDPLGLLASGALIITVSQEQCERLVLELKQKGIQCTIIGEVIADPGTILLEEGGGIRKMPLFERDELARALELEQRNE